MKTAERRDKILKFIKENIEFNGYPPTVREICNALGIKSTSTVHNDIKILGEEGYIKKDPVKRRALMVTDKAYNNKNNTIDHSVVQIPVLGNVAAGQPIASDDQIQDYMPIPSRYVSSGDNFLLKVKGDSMIEAGILNGDMILVKQSNVAENGQMVVALIDGFESEATVKTFYRENGRIRLQPENSSMSPIIVDNARIVGLVKGVFRYF